MRQPQIIRSTTFHWALAVSGVFAVFVIVLFGFIYWQTDDYLIARSDRMIARQLNYITGLPSERRLIAIDEHLAQDSRGVQCAGLFGRSAKQEFLACVRSQWSTGVLVAERGDVALWWHLEDVVQSKPVVKSRLRVSDR